MLDDLLVFASFLSALGVIVGLILLPFKSRRKLGKFLAIVSGIICVSSLTIAVLIAEPTAERKAKLEKREAEMALQREEQIAVARQREEQIKREREEQIRREKEEQTEAAARKKTELAIAAARREYELRAEQEKSRAEAEAKREKEEQCAQDLKCTAEKAWGIATAKCVPLVERIAKNNFEWTDSWYQVKFPRFRWGDPARQSITYMGDKIKYQNSFGAWIYHIYECDFVLATEQVKDVRARPGRLPH